MERSDTLTLVTLGILVHFRHFPLSSDHGEAQLKRIPIFIMKLGDNAQHGLQHIFLVQHFFCRFALSAQHDDVGINRAAQFFDGGILGRNSYLAKRFVLIDFNHRGIKQHHAVFHHMTKLLVSRR